MGMVSNKGVIVNRFQKGCGGIMVLGDRGLAGKGNQAGITAGG